MLPKHCGFSIFSNPKLSEHTFQENRGKTNNWIFVERARSMYKFINCRNRNTFYRLAAHWTWNMTSLIDDILLSTIHWVLPQILQPGIWNIDIPYRQYQCQLHQCWYQHQQFLSSQIHYLEHVATFKAFSLPFTKNTSTLSTRQLKSDENGTCLPMSFYGVVFVGKERCKDTKEVKQT